MKRIMPALFLLGLAAPSFAAEKRFTVTDYDRVQVDGPFEVTLSTGKAPTAAASGSAVSLDRVTIDVQGRVLRVRPNRSAWGGYPGEQAALPRVILSTHDLSSVSVMGSGRLSVDKAKAMRFGASLSGSGHIALGTVETDDLILGLVGSGTIEAGGKTKNLRATIQGSGDFDGGKLIAEDAIVFADTSGTVTANARRTAKVKATGAGDTVIAGDAACTVEAKGSGRVACGR